MTRLLLAMSTMMVAVAFMTTFSNPLMAKVTGSCDNCHTMHNSQEGSPEAVGGSGAGWDAEGKLVGVAQAIPLESLVIGDCVGCHSSGTSETIQIVNESRVPIVYNTVEPDKPLAGGNFYWMVNDNDDSLGHNVWGITGQDSELSYAPGDAMKGTVAACNCHVSLATDPDDLATGHPSGCEGCHEPSHHEDNDWYRFLGHPQAVGFPDHYVTGIEDEDWEEKPKISHNVYKGADEISSPHGWTDRLNNTNTISAFCWGCHNEFHSMGSEGLWLRHPSDAILCPDGLGGCESSGYTAYDPIAPVAKLSPQESDRTVYSVSPEQDLVMCLSCHRPHGSPNPDMLRWPYEEMVAGNASGDWQNQGCFACHRNKDTGS